jgi:hypothetical protein
MHTFICTLTYIYIYTYIHIYIYIYIHLCVYIYVGTGTAVYTSSWVAPRSDVHSQQRFFYMGQKGDDDDVYLRLQHGEGFHNLVYMSYVKHINPAKRHK